MARSFYARFAWPILLVAVLLIPPCIWGTYRAFLASNNNVSQWLPQDYPDTERYKEFRGIFGSDDFAVITWDDCTLDDPRIETLTNALVPPEGAPKGHPGTQCFKRVITGPRAIERLMAPPFELTHEEALERLKGTLVGPDGKTTCAILTLSSFGDADRKRALASMIDIAEQCGLDEQTLRLGGDAVFNAAIDIESRAAIQKWIGLSTIIALVVAWLCLRRLKLIAMVFSVSVYGALVGTALIYFTGGQMNLVMVMVPVLIYVLTLSASVHLANYYRDALHEHGPVGAALRAVKAGWTPCALSAATTALGLGSLYVSHVVPVKMFGLYSAMGVMAGLGVLFLLLPAMMELWPLGEGRTSDSPHDSAAATRRDRILRRMVHRIVKHQRIVSFLCLSVLVVCGAGVVLIETSVRPARFFDPQSRWIKDFHWITEHIGPMVSIEVIFHVDGKSKLTFLEQMELVDRSTHAIQQLDQVGAVISAATYAPPLEDLRRDKPAPAASGRTGRTFLKLLGIKDPLGLSRRTMNRKLHRDRQVFVENRYLSENQQQRLWRITARAVASETLDYDEILTQVQSQVESYLDKHVPDSERIEVIYTGSAPLVFVAQRELLNGLFRSFCLAFVLIAVVMVVLLRSLGAGLLAMLPNVFPAMITFGTMGWMRSAVDVGAMMTASVAMGIAVDDTLHFLTWFRRSTVAGHTRRVAIIHAFRRCAVAMSQTSLIAGLAMLVFVLSHFQPVSQFGLLMFILLIAALVGDLLFLPALLATRAGARFVRSGKARRQSDR